jgi:hypothetical protein
MVNGAITYLYGSCKYFVFGEGKSSNILQNYVLHKHLKIEACDGVDTEYAIFTFYFNMGILTIKGMGQSLNG